MEAWAGEAETQEHGTSALKLGAGLGYTSAGWYSIQGTYYDNSGFTLASFILGGRLKVELPQYIIIGAGGVIFATLVVIGLALTSSKKDRGNYRSNCFYAHLHRSAHGLGLCPSLV